MTCRLLDRAGRRTPIPCVCAETAAARGYEATDGINSSVATRLHPLTQGLGAQGKHVAVLR